MFKVMLKTPVRILPEFDDNGKLIEFETIEECNKWINEKGYPLSEYFILESK